MARPARTLHPAAWWLWAIGLAVVAGRTTNPLLLGLVIGVCALVVSARHEDAPWGRAFGLYLRIGLLIVLIRVAFRILLGGGGGSSVLFSIPEIGLPEWLAGVRLGGDVAAESLLAATYDGLRLATLVICFGAANSLANPRRLLRLVPNALHELGAAITVAASVAPQLAESVVRIGRARRLRGDGGRRRGLRRRLLPLLEDALDRSISLAAAMDSRGYGRAAGESASRRSLTAGLLTTGLVGICIGLYGVLDTSVPWALGMPVLLAGVGLVAVGFGLAGRRARHTRYRPDTWHSAESVVVGSGALAILLAVVGGLIDPGSLHPSLAPIAWPAMAPIPSLGLLVAASPAIVAPMPPLRAAGAGSRPARSVSRPSTVQP